VNGELSYQILSSSDPLHHFAIDSSGEMRIARRLDREKASRYVLVVSATDGGQPALRSQTTVEVIILAELCT